MNEHDAVLRSPEAYVTKFDCGRFNVHIFEESELEYNLSPNPRLENETGIIRLWEREYAEEDPRGIEYSSLFIDTETREQFSLTEFQSPPSWQSVSRNQTAPLISKRIHDQFLTTTNKFIHIETSGDEINVRIDDFYFASIKYRDNGKNKSLELSSKLALNPKEAYRQIELSSILVGIINSIICKSSSTYNMLKQPPDNIYIGMAQSIDQISDTELAIETLGARLSAQDLPDFRWGDDIDSATLAQLELDDDQTTAEVVITRLMRGTGKPLTITQGMIINAMMQVQARRRQ